MDDYNNELSYEASQSRYSEIRAQREQRRAARGEPPRREQRRTAQREPLQREVHPLRETPSYEYTMGGEEDDLFDEGPKGSFGWVLLTQMVVCLLLLGGVFLMKKAAPNTFAQLKTAYTQTMQTDMSAKEVWAAAKEVFRSLKEEIYVVAPYAEAETQPPTQPQSEPETAAQSQPEDLPEDEPENEPEDEPESISDEELNGMGGLDISLAYAEKSCTAVPLLTTVRPLRPVAEGRITSPFGYRIHPISGEEGIHTGLDIAAPEGALIYAAFYGTVSQVGVGEQFGNYIILDHAGGMQTVYAHCSEVLAQEGMVLRAGEIIAKVGSTGVSTGPHLHFELRLKGLRCDPEFLFPAQQQYARKDAAA